MDYLEQGNSGNFKGYTNVMADNPFYKVDKFGNVHVRGVSWRERQNPKALRHKAGVVSLPQPSRVQRLDRFLRTLESISLKEGTEKEKAKKSKEKAKKSEAKKSARKKSSKGKVITKQGTKTTPTGTTRYVAGGPGVKSDRPDPSQVHVRRGGTAVAGMGHRRGRTSGGGSGFAPDTRKGVSGKARSLTKAEIQAQYGVESVGKAQQQKEQQRKMGLKPTKKSSGKFKKTGENFDPSTARTKSGAGRGHGKSSSRGGMGYVRGGGAR